MGAKTVALVRSTGLAILAVVGLFGGAWAAGPSAVEKCVAAKLRALAKRDACVRVEQRNEVIGRPPGLPCGDAFEAAIAKADRRAVRRETSCRWLDHGDGTATDLDTGLQWELKADDGSIHDVDDEYEWSVGVPFHPDGSAFGSFVGALNGGFSAGGTVINGCFANRCDWRLPSVDELRAIAGSAIPGEAATAFYWTSTSLEGADRFAWVVAFPDGGAGEGDKTFGQHVRAVRGDS